MTTEAPAAESTPARHAGRTVPNLVTSESIAAMYAPPANPAPKADPASEAKAEEPKESPQGEAQAKPEKGKKPISERFAEMAAKRRDAEAKADAAQRRAEELEARLTRLEQQAPVKPAGAEPRREDFASDAEYLKAAVKHELAKEKEQEAADKAKVAEQQVFSTWAERVEAAKAEIPDFEEVVRKSEVILPGHLIRATLQSDIGPHITYYFAKHPAEARRFAAMAPDRALVNLGKLEDDLMADPEPAKTPAAPIPTPAAERSRAPEPITPVKDAAPLAVGAVGSKSFEEYRARRQAEKADRRR